MLLKQAIISEKVNVEFGFTLSVREHRQTTALESQRIGSEKRVKGVLIWPLPWCDHLKLKGQGNLSDAQHPVVKGDVPPTRVLSC